MHIILKAVSMTATVMTFPVICHDINRTKINAEEVAPRLKWGRDAPHLQIHIYVEFILNELRLKREVSDTWIMIHVVWIFQWIKTSISNQTNNILTANDLKHENTTYKSSTVASICECLSVIQRIATEQQQQQSESWSRLWWGRQRK